MTYSIVVPKGELVVTDTLYKGMRKKPVLAYRTDNAVVKLASFNGEKAMKDFLKLYGWKGDTE